MSFAKVICVLLIVGFVTVVVGGCTPSQKMSSKEQSPWLSDNLNKHNTVWDPETNQYVPIPEEQMENQAAQEDQVNEEQAVPVE